VKRVYNIIVLVFVAGAFLSCKKEVTYAEAGTTDVSILFTSPEPGTTVIGTQEVSVEARIDAEAMMAGYRVTISDASTGEVIDKVDDLFEQTQYFVHYHWYPSMSATTEVGIRIDALGRDGQSLGWDELTITCSP